MFKKKKSKGLLEGGVERHSSLSVDIDSEIEKKTNNEASSGRLD